MVNKRATRKNSKSKNYPKHSKAAKVSGKRTQKKSPVKVGSRKNRHKNKNRSGGGGGDGGGGGGGGGGYRGGRNSGRDRYHSGNSRGGNNRGDKGKKQFTQNEYEQFKKFQKEKNEQKQYKESNRSSKGKTMEKYLRKIEKRIHKAFCRTKRNCAAYPHDKTLKIIEEFYKNMKHVNDDIKKANGEENRCQGVEKDMDKLDIC